MFKLPITEAQYEVLFRFEKTAPNPGVRAYFTTPQSELDESLIKNSTRTCARQETACRRIFNALNRFSQYRIEGRLGDSLCVESGKEFMSLGLFEVIEPLLPRYQNSPYHEPTKVLLCGKETTSNVAKNYNVDRSNLLRKRRDVIALAKKILTALDDFDNAFNRVNNTEAKD